LPDGVEGGFALGRHLEKLLRLIAGIVSAPAAVDNTFAMRAAPYLAHTAVSYVLAVSGAADAVNVPGVHLMAELFSPFFRDFFPLPVIVVPGGDEGLTISADQSAAGNHFFHCCPPFFFLFFTGNEQVAYLTLPSPNRSDSKPVFYLFGEGCY
jgi:hypothetical protein